MSGRGAGGGACQVGVGGGMQCILILKPVRGGGGGGQALCSWAFPSSARTPWPKPLPPPPPPRYGAAMAVGLACAGTGLREATSLLELMLTDPTDFVRQVGHGGGSGMGEVKGGGWLKGVGGGGLLTRQTVCTRLASPSCCMCTLGQDGALLHHPVCRPAVLPQHLHAPAENKLPCPPPPPCRVPWWPWPWCWCSSQRRAWHLSARGWTSSSRTSMKRYGGGR